jgi:hypothetical protein
MSEASNRRIRPDVIGWVGMALTLLAVAAVQLYGDWGYVLAVPALILLLAGLAGIHREIGR